jgi:hypothetical protein
MNEPIVSREAIRAQAIDAADRGEALRDASPYAVGSVAHRYFLHCYSEHQLRRTWVLCDFSREPKAFDPAAEFM